MRISDWSSDVCSSDLIEHRRHRRPVRARFAREQRPSEKRKGDGGDMRPDNGEQPADVGWGGPELRVDAIEVEIAEYRNQEEDRKSVVEGKRVSVRVDMGGRRSIKKKK